MTRSVVRLAGALGLGLVLGPSAALMAQAVVSALVSDAEPLDSTADVLLSRFADFAAVPQLAVGTELAAGDMLSSVSGRTDVELTCGDATVLRFTGGFRVLIDVPDAGDCALDFLSGTLDVLTDSPTEIDTGAVILGSEGTQYSVELTRDEGEPDRQLTVFDGRVRVRTDGLEEQVGTGTTWRRARGETTWGELGERDLDRAAGRYAAFDAARKEAVAPGADKELAVERFKTLHYAVLSRPDDVEKRAELAREQLEVSQTPQALYHLKRGDLTTEERLERYRIDKGVAELMERRATSTGSLYERTARPLAAAADPFTLVAEERWREAVEAFAERAREEPSSRIYYGLAQAYLGLEGGASERAREYAARALDLQPADHQLSMAEIAHCRRIRDALP